jgi:sarcosine oxidase subunit gamma
VSEPAGQYSHPKQFLRRSQLYRWHLQAGAQYTDANAAGLVDCYPGKDGGSQRAMQLGIADLSTLPRTGFKGREAPAWVQQQDCDIPDRSNRAMLHGDGSLVARLAQEELLILSDLQLNAGLAEQLQQKWSIESAAGVYLLPRADSHCWFALTGHHATHMFSKVCGVDLREKNFAIGDIAQTSLARVNAIIIGHRLGNTPCFYILSDSSSAQFLWTSLLDAALEFDGGPVGMKALKGLAIDS